jgi:hypothetical protein
MMRENDMAPYGDKYLTAGPKWVIWRYVGKE